MLPELLDEYSEVHGTRQSELFRLPDYKKVWEDVAFNFRSKY